MASTVKQPASPVALVDSISEQSEQALLGNLLTGRWAVRSVASQIRPENLEYPAFATVYQAILDCDEGGEDINPLTVCERLERNGLLQSCGGLQEVVALALEPWPGWSPDSVVRHIRDKEDRKRLRLLGHRLVEGSESRQLSPADLARLATDLLDSVARGGDTGPRETPFRAKLLEEVMSAPHPSWLVGGVLPEKGLALLFGPPNTSKTALATDASMAVARGVRWFGRRTRRRGTVYIAAEGQVRPRLAAYFAHHGVAPPDNFAVIDASPNLLVSAGDIVEVLESINAVSDRIGGVGLVVIDTLNRVMPGGNENSAEDMGAAIANFKRIEDATGGCVLVIHHSGKDEGKGPRGSTALLGAADAAIEVCGTENPRTAKVVKMRDGPIGTTLAYGVEVVDLGPSPDPDADDDERLTSVVVVPAEGDGGHGRPRRVPTGKNQKLVLSAISSALAEHGEVLPETSAIPRGVRGVRIEHVIAKARPMIVDVPEDRKPERIRDALGRLRDQGYIGTCEPWVWVER